MSEKKSFAPLFLLIILALIWGTSFILIKKGLVSFSPDEVATLRVSAAALFVLPIAVTQLRGLSQLDFAKLFLSGLIGIFIPSFLFAFAQTRMSSSVAGAMNSLTPLWTMIVGVVLFSQRFRGIAVIGTLIGFTGSTILILTRSHGDTTVNAYAFLIILATALYGCNLNLIKFKIEHVRSLTITTVSVMLIGPLALTYLLGFTQFVPKLLNNEGALRSFGYVVLLGFMSTAVATVLFNKLVKTNSPLFASYVTYLMPIVAVMWGVLDGEHLSLGHYVGMALIIGGVYLANWKR